MKKMIIEARVNEYAMRDGNPNVPWTPKEIAEDALECRDAGASIVHFHARRPDGAPDFAYEGYRDTVARVREASDLLVHPTLGAFARDKSPPERIAHILRLAEDGLTPDFAPMDIASSNVDLTDPETGRFLSEDGVYINTTGTLRYFAEQFRARGVAPYAVVWNIPSLRQTLAFVRNGTFQPPVFAELSLTEGGALVGHPGTVEGLQAYVSFIPKDGSIEWSPGLYGGNLLRLAGVVASLGGHISIGLGDYPYRELGTPRNADVIRRVAAIARDCGREVATPDDARDLLRLKHRVAA